VPTLVNKVGRCKMTRVYTYQRILQDASAERGANDVGSITRTVTDPATGDTVPSDPGVIDRIVLGMLDRGVTDHSAIVAAMYRAVDTKAGSCGRRLVGATKAVQKGDRGTARKQARIRTADYVAASRADDRRKLRSILDALVRIRNRCAGKRKKALYSEIRAFARLYGFQKGIDY